MSRAKNFEVVRNEFGNTEIDANTRLQRTVRVATRGRAPSPSREGPSTSTRSFSGRCSALTRRRPLPRAPAEVDAIAALNPWERLGLDIEVKSPGTLHMVGENVQVNSGAPLGLGAVNVRAFGDLYLYKIRGSRCS